jgi:uncharacterized protein (DUF885 family)
LSNRANRHPYTSRRRVDIREFHDFVLRTGAVPLNVLESEVQRWVENRKG